jgi:hypothetical protein
MEGLRGNTWRDYLDGFGGTSNFEGRVRGTIWRDLTKP